MSQTLKVPNIWNNDIVISLLFWYLGMCASLYAKINDCFYKQESLRLT
jgi:hypothetical protein